jgi:hypothetical protein
MGASVMSENLPELSTAVIGSFYVGGAVEDPVLARSVANPRGLTRNSKRATSSPSEGETLTNATSASSLVIRTFSNSKSLIQIRTRPKLLGNEVVVWQFDQEDRDDPAPGNYKDSSGVGNHFPYTSHVTVTGKFNGGVNANLPVTLPPVISYPTTAISVSTWIKPEAFSGTVTLLGAFIYTGSTPNVWRLYITADGKINFGVRNSSSVETLATSSSSLTSGVFQHVTGTYDGSNVKIYVNGVEVGSGSVSGITFNNTATIRFGASAGNDYIVDDMRVYTRAISTGDMSSLIATPYVVDTLEIKRKPIKAPTDTILANDSDRRNETRVISETITSGDTHRRAAKRWQGPTTPRLLGGEVICWACDADDHSFVGSPGAYTRDSSGNSNHGYTGFSTVVKGVYGDAYNSSIGVVLARDSFVDGSVFLNPPTGSLTAMGWVKLTAYPGDPGVGVNEHAILIGSGNGAWGVNPRKNVWRLLAKYDGSLSFEVKDNAEAVSSISSSGSVFPTGVMKHVAVVYNGTSATIYLDGTQVATGSLPSVTFTSPSIWAGYPGSLNNASPGPSAVDEVRVYNRALTLSEINDIRSNPFTSVSGFAHTLTPAASKQPKRSMTTEIAFHADSELRREFRTIVQSPIVHSDTDTRREYRTVIGGVLGHSDTLTRQPSRRPAVEIITRTQTASRTYLKRITETIARTETRVRQLTRSLVVEALTGLGSLLRSSGRTRSEQVIHSDTELRREFRTVVSNPITHSDSDRRVENRIISENISNADARFRNASRRLSDVETSSDTLLRAPVRRTVIEAMNSVDQLRRLQGKQALESISMSDSRRRDIQRRLTTSISTVDTILRIQLRSLAQTLVHTPSAAATRTNVDAAVAYRARLDLELYLDQILAEAYWPMVLDMMDSILQETRTG